MLVRRFVRKEIGMSRVRTGIALVTMMVIGLIAGVGAQQGGASIRGQVVDAQKAGVPGVPLVITHVESGQFRETVSGPDGSFSVAGVIPGPYKITGTLSGFKALAQEVRLAVGQTLSVELTLQLDSFNEAVTVKGDAATLDLTSTQISDSVGQEELTNLPTVKRGFGGMVALMPGVVYIPSFTSNDSFAVNGSSSAQIMYVLDGSANQDDRTGGNTSAQARPGIEAIQEFQVVTNQFDAEYGTVSGGVVNAITKQGTNLFRGSLFYHVTNSSLIGKDFFAKQNNLPKPDTSKLQYGGTIGGPIVRNKFHFFFAYERIHQEQGVTHIFPTRSDLNYTHSEFINNFNTVVRVDHQINSNNTWSFRHLRDWQPNLHQIPNTSLRSQEREEYDNDQTMSGTYNRVLGNSKVNVLKIGRTRENNNRGAKAFLDDGPGKDRADLLQPTLAYRTYTDGDAAANTRRWQISYNFDDQFSWFKPTSHGDHDFKVGALFIEASHRQLIATNINGTFSFPSDRPFNSADPSTYPERLQVRVPVAQEPDPKMQNLAVYFQDKWKATKNLTVNLGVRWDADIVKVPEAGNPLFREDKYPKDLNNFQPRVGVAYSTGGRGVVRVGYGRFFEKTVFGDFENYFQGTVFQESFVTSFPANGVDPGPSAGRLPTDPLLINGPVLNTALLKQLVPVGSRARVTGNVALDNPDRVNPHTDSFTAGYEFQLLANMTASMDYIHKHNSDVVVNHDLNPGLKANTGRTTAVVRTDTRGLAAQLGISPFVSSVTIRTHAGDNTYDGVNLSLDRRFAGFWSGRVSYSWGKGRGIEGTANPFQVGDQQNLDSLRGPLSGDRTHIFSTGGVLEVPKTKGLKVSLSLRAMSGSPFTIQDTNVDENRNGLTPDPLPAGTYTGTGPNAYTAENKGGINGARGPGYLSVDTRAGWSFKLSDRRSLDVFVEGFNITNEPNFTNPSGDRRTAATFLNLQSLVGDGFPRAFQVGARLGF
jgi:hypothetical protein